MTNILVVVSDDQRDDTLRFMPNVRNLLVASGTRFTRARVDLALCQPSRVGFFTGRSSLQHGVTSNASLGGFDHDDTFARRLRDAGYRTAMVGKYLNSVAASGGMTPAPAGWDVWRELVGPVGGSYGAIGYEVNTGSARLTPSARLDEYLRDEVVEFVSGAEPWFCYMASTSPHTPWQPDVTDLFAWSHVLEPGGSNEDVSTKPTWIRSLPPIRSGERAGFGREARGQLRELRALDRAIADVVGSLSAPVLADTVIALVSDNGQHWGEHNIRGTTTKNTIYESALRVPLVATGPGFTGGGEVGAPVWAMQDLARTACAVAGVAEPPDSLSVDLRSIVADQSSFDSRATLHATSESTQLGNAPWYPRSDGVVTATRKLFRFPDFDGIDRYEAYDLDDDPGEVRNWANDADRRVERDDLEAQLDSLLAAPVAP